MDFSDKEFVNMLDPRRGPVHETNGYSPNKVTSPYDSNIQGFGSLKEELSNRDRERQSLNSSNVFKRANTKDSKRE
jgi:hypothetical protein